MNLKTIYLPIQSELEQVNECIKKNLNNTDYAKLSNLNKYILNHSGKKIRAALLLLTYKAILAHFKTNKFINNPNEFTIDYAVTSAAVIECIHLASLIHDDIIDQSQLRHNQATVWAKYGTNDAVILGVYIYSVALNLLSQSSKMHPLINIISQMVKSLCEGEFYQMNERFQWYLTFEQYLYIIDKKTASLFSVSCLIGAYMATNDKKEQQNWADIGLYLGRIFQITDDCLDIFDKNFKLQKESGQDIISGEITLPFIYLFQELSSKEKNQLIAIIKNKPKDLLPYFTNRLEKYNILEKIVILIKEYTIIIQTKLNLISDSQEKQSIEKILNLITNRFIDN